MEGLYRYYLINMKRMLKLLPAIIAGVILLCCCVLSGIYVLVQNSSADHTKLKIGVVGEIENSYLEYGITALQSMDSTRYVVELTEVNEEEAASMVKKGELTAYMVITDGFVDSVMYGSNDIRVDYVCGEGDAGLIGMVMEEIVDSYSGYVTGSQSVIYAAEAVNRSVNGKKHLSKEQLVDINARCINSVLTREKFCRLEFSGISYNLSAAAYYLCGIFVIFLLLSGINSCMYFNGRSRDFQRISLSHGGKIWWQILGEYIPFLLLSLCITICVWISLTFAFSLKIMYIDEWSGDAIVKLWEMFFYIIPVVVFITVIQMLIYEIADNLIGSILLQFILSICIGYVSGCFYPEQYFPESVRNISSMLPPKMAVKYMASFFSGKADMANSIGMLLYAILCVAIIYLVRGHRLKKQP